MELFDLSLFNMTLRSVTPILLAALGGAICGRVGLFNVGLEGKLLVGAFTAIVGNHVTGNVWMAVTFSVLCVMLYSLLFAYMSIQLKANVIVVGIALNFLALGLTTFSLRAIFQVKGAYYDREMVGLPRWNVPLLDDVPVIGPYLSGIFSGHSPVIYLAFVLVALLQYYLFKTISGFRMMASGGNPLAARSLGVPVVKYQYGAVLICGALCGLGGAQLSLGQVTMFTEGMTAGRGFIALVATMLGQSNPLGVAGASVLFGFLDALSIRLQGFSLPTQFTMMLPYVVTLVAMFFFKDKSYLQEARKGNESSR